MSTRDSALRDRFHTLYEDNHGWLYAWLCKKTGCVHKAQDVAQNAFLRLLSITDLSAIREPRAFLTTTASRLIIDETRRQKVEQRYLETFAYHHGEQIAAKSAEDLVLISEALLSIITMLEGLSEKCQRAFLMSRIDGLKHAEIAAHLGVSRAMVKQYIAKAMVRCYELTYPE